jgi:hypothetical protein
MKKPNRTKPSTYWTWPIVSVAVGCSISDAATGEYWNRLNGAEPKQWVSRYRGRKSSIAVREVGTRDFSITVIFPIIYLDSLTA